MKTAITLTCYKRADYLKQVLQSIEQSLKYSKINDMSIYFSIDYFDDEIPDLVQNIDWADIRYVVNKPSIGCNKNTRNAIMLGLIDNDAVIHLEDDTVITKDGVDYFIRQLNTYYNDPEIICLGGYSRTMSLDNANLSSTDKQKRFTCWGCGFWKHKIKPILENWTPYLSRDNNSSSWDTHLDESLFQNEKYNFYQIVPTVSRIQNIGADGGTWVPDAHFHYANHHSPFTSNDLL